ncbi:MAG: CPBP family intramembrane metalloprotease [Oscillospiraceae bacterium]|nr:CPBP family intramembrane metalloprotease [Oscillospiraceae bacterium]
MTEFNENEAVVGNSDELKQNEIKDFKKLLFLLAVTVIAATVIPRLLVYIINLALSSAPEVTAEATETVTVSALEQNFFYFLIWFLSHLVIFVPSFLLFGFAFKDKMTFKKQGLPYEFKMSWLVPIFIASYALSIIASFISHLVAYLLQPVFGGGGLRDVFEGVMPQTAAEVIIMLIMVGLISPVLEELIYRHLLLVPLRRYGDFQAVIITALLFGFFHGNFTQFLYTTMGGLIYGIVAVRANSVKPAIALHIINNVFAILLSQFFAKADTAENPLLTLIANLFPYGMLALGAVILIYFCVKGRFKTENRNPFIPAADRLRMVAENPFVLIMMIVLIADTIIGT